MYSRSGPGEHPPAEARGRTPDARGLTIWIALSASALVILGWLIALPLKAGMALCRHHYPGAPARNARTRGQAKSQVTGC